MEQALREELGPELNVYSLGADNRIGLGIVIVVVGLLLLAFRVLFGVRVIIRGDETLLLVGLLGLGFIGYGLMQKQSRLSHYQNGLTVRKFFRTKTILWSDVTELQQYYRTEHFGDDIMETGYRVLYQHADDPDQIKLSDFELKEMKEFGPVLEEEVSKRLLPETLKDFNAGNEQQFGVLWVTEEGIENDDYIMPWEKLTGIKVSDLKVQVLGPEGVDDDFTASVNRIPDARLLTKLVDAILIQK